MFKIGQRVKLVKKISDRHSPNWNDTMENMIGGVFIITEIDDNWCKIKCKVSSWWFDVRSFSPVNENKKINFIKKLYEKN